MMEFIVSSISLILYEKYAKSYRHILELCNNELTTWWLLKWPILSRVQSALCRYFVRHWDVGCTTPHSDILLEVRSQIKGNISSRDVS